MSGDLDLDAVFGRSSPDEAFAAVLTEARMVLAEIASPLEAELWGSDILAALGGDAQPGRAGHRARRGAQRQPGGAGHPARARARSGWPELRAPRRLRRRAGWRARGCRTRPGRPRLGTPEVRECWRYGDDRGLQEAVTLSFEYPAGRHVVSLLLDHSFGGGIKNVWVGEAGDVLARTEAMAAADPGMTFEMISPADARRRAERAIAAGECPGQPDEFSSVASTRAILRARVALLADL